MSGSKGPAETGTLVFLTGGDQDLFHEIEKKQLAAMGKGITTTRYLGSYKFSRSGLALFID